MMVKFNMLQILKRNKTGKEGDKVKYAFSNLDFWFDNFFIAYGKQN